MRLLLGIDLGTSYFKIGLFDATGELRGLGRVRVVWQGGEAGRSELPPEEFWRLLRHGLGEALSQAHATVHDIGGVSYSSQANTFVALDADLAPVTPLIGWRDGRARVEQGDAEFSATAEFHRTTGFAGLPPESAVVKWRWLQREQPQYWARAARLLTLSDYFAWSLTGEFVGDGSTAALLGLYDLSSRGWWPKALAHFGVRAEQLATPLVPGTARGQTNAVATERLGLPAGIPFAVGALDHHAAALGAGLGTFADASVSTGTVLAAICVVDHVAPLAGCLHGPHVDGRRFYRLAFDPNGAGELEQFQRQLVPHERLDDLIARAAGEPAAGAAAHDALHAGARAILERVARAQAALLRTLAPGQPLRVIAATGGGARSARWLELMARTIGVPVIGPGNTERACLGAAVFAARAAGLFPSLEEAAASMVRPPGRDRKCAVA